ncbi:MAG: helix-turn-helix domain-containing protein [bacterium]
MDSFGEYLRRERELRHIELDEISRVTKIKKSYLQAIENDAYDELPDIPLVKGFIRAYCNYLGLNAEQTVNLFQQLYDERFKAEKPPSKSWIRINRSKVLIFTGTAILLMVFVLIIYHSSKEKTKEYSLEHETGAEQTNITSTSVAQPITSAASAITLSTASSPTTGTSFTVTIKQHTLLLKATEDTWVRLTQDENKENAQEALLKGGEQVLWKFTGTALLTVGNAQGIEIFLDNKKIQHNRTKAEVIKLKL